MDIPRRDIVLANKPEDRKPCPSCLQPAESVRYESAMIEHMDVAPQKGFLQVSFRITGARAAEFQPCGHRFDGVTGQQIEDATATS